MAKIIIAMNHFLQYLYPTIRNLMPKSPMVHILLIFSKSFQGDISVTRAIRHKNVLLLIFSLIKYLNCGRFFKIMQIIF